MELTGHMIGLCGKEKKVKVKDDPGFSMSNLVNPLLFGEMGQMGEAETKWTGENMELVQSFLFPPLPPTLGRASLLIPLPYFLM